MVDFQVHDSAWSVRVVDRANGRANMLAPSCLIQPLYRVAVCLTNGRLVSKLQASKRTRPFSQYAWLCGFNTERSRTTKHGSWEPLFNRHVTRGFVVVLNRTAQLVTRSFIINDQNHTQHAFILLRPQTVNRPRGCVLFYTTGAISFNPLCFLFRALTRTVPGITRWLCRVLTTTSILA